MKITILLAVISLLGVRNAIAQQGEIFAPNGRALKGYDVVAFFKQSKPVKGKEIYSIKWKNATWLFSNEENLKDFTENPEKFAPQYGGYCAYGVSQGHKAPVQLETWTLLDDKLYFNYNTDVQKLWNKDRPKLIEVANDKWRGIKTKSQ